MNPHLLNYKSSCDDKLAAVIKNGVLLSNVIGQAVHRSYGESVLNLLYTCAHQQNNQPARYCMKL